MTTECYVSACPFHSFHDEIDQGPFCFHEECQVSPSYIKTVQRYRPDSLQDDEIAKLEKEHMGDPDKKTGIYHPDNIRAGQSVETAGPVPLNHLKLKLTDEGDECYHEPVLAHYSVRYEWRIADNKTLASTVYFDALGHRDAMKQFFAIYNGSKPLVSLTIKKSRP